MSDLDKNTVHELLTIELVLTTFITYLPYIAVSVGTILWTFGG